MASHSSTNQYSQLRIRRHRTRSKLYRAVFESLERRQYLTTPVVTIEGDSQIEEGATFSLTLAADYAGDNTITKWVVDWGDGVVQDVIDDKSATASHVYDGPFSGHIGVGLWDQDGFHAVLDPSFDGDGVVTTNMGSTNDVPNAVLVQPDGKILVAGIASGNFGIARYNTDGSPDSSFGTGGKVTTVDFGGNDQIFGLTIQPNGKILAVGSTSSSSNWAIARYNTDGALDSSFSSGGKLAINFDGSDTARSVSVLPGGKILIGGTGNGKVALARLLANGTLDSGFGTGGKLTDATAAVASMVVQPDGRIVVGGSAGGDAVVYRYLANGTIDTSFSADGVQSVNLGESTDGATAIALQADGKIVGVGATNVSPSVGGWSVFRINSDGSIDNSFATNGLAQINYAFEGNYSNGMGSAASVTIQPDGRIVAGGIKVASPNLDFAFARFTPSGALDTSFGTNGTWTYGNGTGLKTVRALTIQPGDSANPPKIVAVGNANTDFRVMRFTPLATLPIEVMNVVPSATLDGPSSVELGSTYTLSIATATDPGDDTITGWAINWGDDVDTGTGAPPSTLTHVYAGQGSHTIRGSVTDEDGTHSFQTKLVNVIWDSGAGALTAAGVGAGRVNFKWTDTPASAASYKIQMWDDIVGAFITRATIPSASTTSFHMDHLEADADPLTSDVLNPLKQYRFRLESFDSNSNSLGYSNVIAVNTLGGNTIYSNDFENGVAEEWASTGLLNVQTTPIDARRFLGEFGWNRSGPGADTEITPTLSLTNLPAGHDTLTVSFDLFILKSWDGSDIGSYGTDTWSWSVDGTEILEATFSNHAKASDGNHTNHIQTYPASVSGTETYPAHFGSSERNTLGYKHPYRDERQDSVYRISATIPHTSSDFTLDFASLGLQDITDESWGIDNVRVETTSSPSGNGAPTLDDFTQETHNLPPQTHQPIGPVQVTNPDGSTSNTLALTTNSTSTHDVHVRTSPVPRQKMPVDIFLLLEDRWWHPAGSEPLGGFEKMNVALADHFPDLMAELRREYPDIDFGIGVGRMESYARKLQWQGDNEPANTQERPFILNQPIVHLNSTDFVDAHDARRQPSQAESAILDALRRRHNEFEEASASGRHVSTIEALYQIATGAGWDAGEFPFDPGDGSTTSDGVTGSYEAQIEGSVINHANRGYDVPAFDSFALDPLIPAMLPPIGTRGGVGFRKGALPIILVATGSPLIYNSTETGQEDNIIMGNPDGIPVALPEARFRGGIDSYTIDDNGVPDQPGHLAPESVNSGATIQQTVDALNALGARVIGLGADTFLRPYDYYPNPDPPYVFKNLDHPLPPTLDPRGALEAIAELTGAVNRSGNTISGNQGSDDVIDPGDPLFFKIPLLSQTELVPDPVSLADVIHAAVGATLAEFHSDVDIQLSNPNLTLTNLSGPALSVTEGTTTPFQITIASSGTPASSDLLFVDRGTGRLHGSLPITATTQLFEQNLTALADDGDTTASEELRFRIKEARVIESGNAVDASIETRGTEKWFVMRPTEAGTYQIDIEVSDYDSNGNQLHAITKINKITVSESAASNWDPTIDPIADQTAVADQAFSLNAVASDADGDDIRYYLYNAPDGVSIDSSTGTISWTPTREQLGPYEITLMAFDDAGGRAIETFDLLVTKHSGLNRAPVVISPANVTIPSGKLWRYEMNAIDYDDDPITYGLLTHDDGSTASLPDPGMRFDESGSLIWTNPVHPGTTLAPITYVVHLEAKDSQGDATPFTLTITVLPPPPLPPSDVTINRVLRGSEVFEHTVSWDSSPTSGAKYNLYFTPTAQTNYRANVSPFYKLNLNPLDTTELDLKTLRGWDWPQNTEYGFVVAAVDPQTGQESERTPILFAYNNDDFDPPAAYIKLANVQISRNRKSVGFLNTHDFGSSFEVMTEDDFVLDVDAADVTWEIVEKNSGNDASFVGSIYHAGNTDGVDIVKATYGSAVGFYWIQVGTGTVSNDDTSVSISGTEGEAFSRRLISAFMRPFFDGQVDQIAIDWDTSTTSDVIDTSTGELFSVGNGLYYLFGSHTYLHDRPDPADSTSLLPYNIAVAVSPMSGPAFGGTGSASIADAPIDVRIQHIYVTYEDNPSNITLANIIDSNLSSSMSHFDAFVHWNDGGTWELATLTNVNGVYIVQGGHAYGEVGDKNVSLRIVEDTVNDNVNTGRIRFEEDIVVRVLDTDMEDVPAPTGVVGIPISPSEVRLTWAPVEHSNIAGYKILRINPGGTTTWLPDTNSYTQFPYTDSNLTPNTSYRYVVYGSNAHGDLTRGSLTATVRTPEVYVPPNVTGVTAQHMRVKDPSNGNAWIEGVQLFWDPRPTLEPSVIGYAVYRKDLQTGQWDSILPAGQVVDPTSDLVDGKLSYFDGFDDENQNEIPESWYKLEYRIVTLAAGGSSAGTDVIGFKDIVPPTNPTNVAAASFPQAIQLTWDDRPISDDGDWVGWNVYRVVGDQWNEVNKVKLNPYLISGDTGFDDYTAATGTTYTYSIRSIDALGNESSGTLVTKRRAKNGEPPAPGSLSALPFGGDIVLQWAAVNPTLVGPNDALGGYKVSRATNAALTDLTPLVTLTGGTLATTWTDQNAAANTEYYYVVTAFDQDTPQADESARAIVRVRNGNGIAPPAPGTSSSPAQPYIVFDGTTDTSIKLTWTLAASAANPEDTAEGYLIYRSTGSEPFHLTGHVRADATEYTDRGLKPGTVYNYRVYAIDTEGDVSVPLETQSGTDSSHTILGGQAKPPYAIITSPTSSTSKPLVISSDLIVRGVVDDPNDNLVSWKLVLRPIPQGSQNGADPGADIQISEGTTERGKEPLTDAVLGSIRPSLVPDGLYHLVLIAKDNVNTTTSVISPLVQIRSEVKTGNFVLPIVDLELEVPGGPPITVTRVYDSSKANVLGDFGYGWRLEISSPDVVTTARTSIAATINPGASAHHKAMQFGDLVYVTLQGGQRHTFQFMPRPSGYKNASPHFPDPMNEFYEFSVYEPMFVAVDGSDAILTVPFGPNGIEYLVRRDGEFRYEGNPAVPYFPAYKNDGVNNFPGRGGLYLVRTADGTIHTIEAISHTDGSNQYDNVLQTITDANGDIIYDRTAPQSNAQAGEHQIKITPGSYGRVAKIEVIQRDGTVIGAPIEYKYENDSTNLPMELTRVVGRDGKSTRYTYDTTGRHFLTSVSDPRDQDSAGGYDQALSISYNMKTGQVQAVTDAAGNTAPVRSSGFDGSAQQETVTDLAGNDTEFIYDTHGNVTREIRTVKDANGVVTGYTITVHEFIYQPENYIIDILVTGQSSVNALERVTEYQPFTISDFDDRYTAQPTRIAREVTYYGFSEGRKVAPPSGMYFPNLIDPNVRQVHQETIYDQNGVPRTTTYEHYKLGKPQQVTDPDGRKTYFKYDDGGNLLWTANALGEGTLHTYSIPAFDDNRNGSSDAGDTNGLYEYHDGTTVKISELPQGLLLESFRIEATNIQVNDGVLSATTRIIENEPESANYYYYDVFNPSDPEHITAPTLGSRGKLAATINSAGIKTAYAYDKNGRNSVTATHWVNSNGDDRWVVSRNVYDSSDRVIETWQSVFEDDDTSNDGTIDDRVFSWDVFAGGTQPANGQKTLSLGEVNIKGSGYRNERMLSSTTYNALGQVATTTDQYGGVTTNFYDKRGLLVRTTYPDGTETRSVYDAMGRSILSTSRFNPTRSEPIQASKSIYDSLGRVVETQKLSGVSITLTQQGSTDIFDVTGVTSAGIVTDQNGNWTIDPSFDDQLSSTKSIYNESGRVIETVNAGGLRSGTIYYENGQVHYTGHIVVMDDEDPAPSRSQIFRDLGETIEYIVDYTEYSYDRSAYFEIKLGGTVAATDIITVNLRTEPLATPDSVSVTVGTEQTLQDVTAALATAINAKTGGLYDGIQAVVHDGVIRVFSLSPDFEFLLDAPTPNNVSGGEDAPTISVRKGVGSLMEDGNGHQALSVQDAGGRSVVTIFDDGSLTETTHGFFGDLDTAEKPSGLTTAVTYVKSIEQRSGGSAAAAAMITIRYYDLGGRLVAVRQPDPDGAGPLGVAVWKYEYDENGNQSKQIDPLGRETVFEYDELGRRTKRTLPAVGTTVSETWSYDDYGRVHLHKDFKGQTTWYRYDSSAAHGGRLDYEYRFSSDIDPLVTDNPATYNPAFVEKTRYLYDDSTLISEDRRKSLGRVARVLDSKGSTLQHSAYYDYDPITGARTLVESDEGNIHHEYDPATGRLVRTYTGDADTNHSSISDDGKAVSDLRYFYDDFGRLEKVVTFELNDYAIPQSDRREITYTYDAVGNLQSVSNNNGTSSTSDDLIHEYTYDALNRLDTVSVYVSNNLSFYQDYEVAADGQRTGVFEFRDGESTQSETYITWEYDAWNRLIQETFDVGGDGINGDDYIDTYTFDLVGNRLTKEHDETGSGNDATTAYVYNARDQLTSEGPDTNSDGTPDILITSYSYDPNGSTTVVSSPGGTKKYVWDLRNRLVGYDANGDDSLDDTGDATFAYDHDGVRVSRTVVNTGSGNVVTKFLQDTNNPTGYSQVLEETTSGEVRTSIIGQRVEGQLIEGGNFRWIVSDGHGSTRWLMDDGGSIVPGSGYDYDAYGNPLDFDPATADTPILYTNQLFDPVLGQYVLRARYYDPTVGRFSSFDSYEDEGSDPRALHKYLYAHANPVLNIDPSGLSVSLPEKVLLLGINTLLFAMRHPTLVAVGGFVASVLLPGDVVDALDASGIKPFQFAGKISKSGKGVIKLVAASKTPWFRNVLSKINKSLRGSFDRATGHLFEDVFAEMLPNAQREVRVGRRPRVDRYNADFVDDGFVHQIKTSLRISGEEIEQLKHTVEYAKKNGLTAVYHFLRLPAQDTIDKIQNAGAHVVYYYE